MTVDINLYEGFVSKTWAQLGQGRMGHMPPFFRLGSANYYVVVSALLNSFVLLDLTVAYGVMQTQRKSFALQSMRNATISDVMDRVHSSSQNEEDLKLSLVMERFWSGRWFNFVVCSETLDFNTN